jgi:hypothetical protein
MTLRSKLLVMGMALAKVEIVVIEPVEAKLQTVAMLG